jgi:hypothetical protein
MVCCPTVNAAPPAPNGPPRLPDRNREALLQAARDTPEALLARLNTSAEGLSALQSRLRLERVGPNAIAHEQPVPWPLQLLRTFRNPLVLLLAALASLSLLSGDTKAALIGSLTDGSAKYSKYDYLERTFTFPSPGLALMAGRFDVKAIVKGNAAESTISYLAVWRLEHGVWKFLAWQSCKIPPATPAK